ncbi:TauD/TfdA family dioxygenase [Amylibacter sp.]|nr:TauD/TfdA family dioxygenase [Amylibacter sp.]MDB9856792.1 TauD/TfdA family dioxygenase [Amylibacter sp.]
MSALNTSLLHPKFGKIVEGVDLRDVREDHLFPEIRQVFDEHSALLFPAQSITDDDHTRLAQMFGPLENREAMAQGRAVEFKVSPVSNEVDGGVSDAEALHTLNLRANMLWHTDSTFLPIPALVNLLTAKVVPEQGGQTELASTRVGWAEMPDNLKEPLKDAVIWHRLSHSRQQVSAELGAMPEMRQWPDRPWRAIWPNPVTGEDALYIASHAFAVEGMGLAQGQTLISEAIAFCTREENVYSHEWQVGDVLIWDERAMLHRGQPWLYEQPRTLMSICCSATKSDGLNSVRIV